MIWRFVCVCVEPIIWIWLYVQGHGMGDACALPRKIHNHGAIRTYKIEQRRSMTASLAGASLFFFSFFFLLIINNSWRWAVVKEHYRYIFFYYYFGPQMIGFHFVVESECEFRFVFHRNHNLLLLLFSPEPCSVCCMLSMTLALLIIYT